MEVSLQMHTERIKVRSQAIYRVPIAPRQFVGLRLHLQSQGGRLQRRLTAQTHDAFVRNADPQEIFKELIEGMIRVTNDEDGPAVEVMESFCDQCPNKRLSST